MSYTSEITFTETLVAHQCGVCGTWFAMSQRFIDERKEDKATWYCPNGHGRMFAAKSKAQLLEEERQRHLATRDLLDAEERSHNATKGHLTRQKKRASAGVCPCCNRTFQQLSRHMAAKHPNFGKNGS